MLLGDSNPLRNKLGPVLAACLFGLLGFTASAGASSYAPGQILGGEGSGEGLLQEPYGVDVDPLGNVFVADSGNHRIAVYDSSGQLTDTFGEEGTAEDQFDYPTGVTFAPDETAWVSDPGLDRLQHFDENGISVITAGLGGNPLIDPVSTTFDGEGRFLVPEAGAGRVQRFSSNGTPIDVIGSPGTGNGQFSVPSGVAVDPSGDIHVADAVANRIQTFNPQGGFVSSLGSTGSGPAQFSNPFGLEFDSDGDLFVADSSNQRVQQISPAGSQVSQFKADPEGDGTVPAPWGIAAGPLDSMYVSYPGADVVRQWVLKRDLVLSRGGSGAGTVTSNPAGLSCTAGCTRTFDNGDSVTLTATAAAGSGFAGWSGACSGTGPCALPMTGDRAVTATFTLDRRLTVSKNGTGSGTVTSGAAGILCGSACAVTLPEGTAVSLAAAPADGSVFTGWSGDCSGTGGCKTGMGSDRDVTATFDLKPAAIVKPPPPAVLKAPKAKITSKPGKKTKSKAAAFKFRANLAGSKFSCRIDRKKFTSCKSPKKYRGLKPGRHTFEVKAKAAGLTGSAAAYTWKVKKAKRKKK